jgi:hypothetical protein
MNLAALLLEGEALEKVKALTEQNAALVEGTILRERAASAELAGGGGGEPGVEAQFTRDGMPCRISIG